MKFSKLLIGNTSSGILEAASFHKYVINLGERQRGRLCSDNIIHLSFDKNAIIATAKDYAKQTYQGKNVYYQESPSKKILNILKQEYAALL